jgi:hypothetical protein
LIRSSRPAASRILRLCQKPLRELIAPCPAPQELRWRSTALMAVTNCARASLPAADRWRLQKRCGSPTHHTPPGAKAPGYWNDDHPGRAFRRGRAFRQGWALRSWRGHHLPRHPEPVEGSRPCERFPSPRPPVIPSERGAGSGDSPAWAVVSVSREATTGGGRASAHCFVTAISAGWACLDPFGNGRQHRREDEIPRLRSG